MADAHEIARLQQDIVRAVAGNVSDVMDGEWEDREWVHLFVDIEMDQDGGRSSSITFALARKAGRPPEKIAFRLPREAKQGFHDLAEAMRNPGEGRWSSAQVRIDRDGGFAFDFSHEPPRRLGGDLIDKRFETYLAEWLETPKGAAFARQENPARRGPLGRLHSLLSGR